MAQANGNADDTSGHGRKERLLEAAIIEFGQSGLAGARVDSIAKAAGVNKQLLYHYFGDKAQLQREVMSAVMRRQDREDALAPASHSLKEYMAERCRRAIVRSLPRLWGRLLAWEALEHGAAGSVHFEERRARYDKAVVERVRQAQASGEIDPTFDPNLVALALLAIELIPRALPNVTRMMTGFSGDEPEFGDKLIALMDQFIDHLAPTEKPVQPRVVDSVPSPLS